ncbi:MAG: DEAD/DEAH box helicase [Bacteroidales bacterium]|nr:DEAD/DEAH box helicase [Bacteroidales bacterium]
MNKCLQLLTHQIEALEETKQFNRVAYYHDMGLGKTFTGAEKLHVFNNEYNLLVCQKSKVNDWVEHFKEYYPELNVIDYTKSKAVIDKGVIIVNYELCWRRPELMSLRNFTLILDESSLIQNESAKRSKFILKMLPKNVILLSGTPTSGKYEKLWSQCRLLGWNISKRDFYKRYIIEQDLHIKTSPFPIRIVVGYKNVEELKIMLRKYGANFLKTEDVLELPEQTFVNIEVDTIPSYRKFQKDRIVTIEGETLVGDTALTKMLYERMLCGHFNKNKLQAFADLIESTDDRLIVFYNYNRELEELQKIAKNRPISIINGSVKDLDNYNTQDNAITFCQYQAAAMGHNLQKANKIVYFTLPLSSELFEQSKKRTHRIGQTKPCFYYFLMCKNSIEERILDTLKKRKDYTERLFIQDDVFFS